MEADHNIVKQLVEEDRMSSLPDELLHKILTSFDMKFVVQTCLLSSRWKLLWTSMPCLSFSIRDFCTSRKFNKFVKHVLSDRNHQVQVSSVELSFERPLSDVLMRKVADYAFSHNVQELDIYVITTGGWIEFEDYPLCLLGSKSLKHFNFNSNLTLKTPLDFPALTTLHLNHMILCGELFSKCVNLKNLSLANFSVNVNGVEVFDIITPRLSYLTLINGEGFIRCLCINLIAPQLEHLTIKNCSIKSLNVPPSLSCFWYMGNPPLHLQLCEDRFHSLNEVVIYLNLHFHALPYTEKYAQRTINMLQHFHDARSLTFNSDTIECISSFPELLSHHPSPFSNLIRLTIEPSKRKNAHKVKMSSVARNFLLENSPNCKFIME